MLSRPCAVRCHCAKMVSSLKDARGTQGTEAECEQCSAVCLCLLSICLLWSNINLENSFKVCVSKARVFFFFFLVSKYEIIILNIF